MKKRLRETMMRTLAIGTLMMPHLVQADQYQQVDVARGNDKTTLLRLGYGTNELPLGSEAYTMTDMYVREEIAHVSETTIFTPLVGRFGLVGDAVLSSQGDYLNVGLGYSGMLPGEIMGTVFFTPLSTGEGAMLGIFGVRAINDRFSAEGFYLRQYLDGQDTCVGELQGNVKVREGLDAFVTGVTGTEGNSLRVGLRLK